MKARRKVDKMKGGRPVVEHLKERMCRHLNVQGGKYLPQ